MINKHIVSRFIASFKLYDQLYRNMAEHKGSIANLHDIRKEAIKIYIEFIKKSKIDTDNFLYKEFEEFSTFPATILKLGSCELGKLFKSCYMESPNRPLFIVNVCIEAGIKSDLSLPMCSFGIKLLKESEKVHIPFLMDMLDALDSSQQMCCVEFLDHILQYLNQIEPMDRLLGFQICNMLSTYNTEQSLAVLKKHISHRDNSIKSEIIRVLEMKKKE